MQAVNELRTRREEVMVRIEPQTNSMKLLTWTEIHKEQGLDIDWRRACCDRGVAGRLARGRVSDR